MLAKPIRVSRPPPPNTRSSPSPEKTASNPVPPLIVSSPALLKALPLPFPAVVVLPAKGSVIQFGHPGMQHLKSCDSGYASNWKDSEGSSGVSVLIGRRDDQPKPKHFLDEPLRQRAGDSTTGTTMFEDGDKSHLRVLCGNVAREPAVVTARTCFCGARLSGDRNIFGKHRAMTGAAARRDDFFKSSSHVLKSSFGQRNPLFL